MADTIVISCPECNKQLKTPPNLQGKKIRCKACGHTFTALSRGGRADADNAQAPPKDKSKAKGVAKADFEADYNPYSVVETDLAHRCPHCAGEMESEDAIICLHCGYNTHTREKHETKKTYKTTGGDVFMWLLPGIVCALVVLALIGFIVFLFIWLGDIVEANKEAWWVFSIRAMKLWGTVFSLFGIFFAGMFAIKRLIFHPTPPEKIKL